MRWTESILDFPNDDWVDCFFLLSRRYAFYHESKLLLWCFHHSYFCSSLFRRCFRQIQFDHLIFWSMRIKHIDHWARCQHWAINQPNPSFNAFLSVWLPPDVKQRTSFEWLESVPYSTRTNRREHRWVPVKPHYFRWILRVRSSIPFYLILIFVFRLVPCTNTSSNITLLNAVNISSINYAFYSYSYKTCASSATLTFGFRHDVDSWFLDDVSVSDGSSNLVINGGFELSIVGWSSYTQGGTSSGGGPNIGWLGNPPHSGVLCYQNGIYNDVEYLSQTFPTVPNFQYNISFWLRSNALANYSGAVVTAHVFITPWKRTEKDWRFELSCSPHSMFHELIKFFIGIDDKWVSWNLLGRCSWGVPHRNFLDSLPLSSSLFLDKRFVSHRNISRPGQSLAVIASSLERLCSL